MKITNEWATPIGELNITLPVSMRVALIELLIKQNSVLTEKTYDNAKSDITNHVINIFDYSRYNSKDQETVTHLKEFEHIASKVIRKYISEAWGVDGLNSNIKVRGFGSIQRTMGRRTAPHYHHGWDGVLLHYLTVGGEQDWMSIDPSDWDFYHRPYHTDYSGELILLDPRPSIRMPHNNKAKTYSPEIGMTILKPGYLWHETHTHTKVGTRVGLVVNFNIVDRNCDLLPTPLIEV